MRATVQIQRAAPIRLPAPQAMTRLQAVESPQLGDALAILDLFTATRRVITGAEIIAATGMSSSLAAATLAELRCRGLVDSQRDDDIWTVGLRTLELAYAHRRENPLVAAAMPVLEHMRGLTNETTMLAVRWGDFRVNAAQAVSSQPLHQDIPEGLRKPLYIGAGGKILLSAMSDEAIEEYLARVPLERRSLTTTTDRDQLLRTVAKIRETGYAETFSERNSGGASLGRRVCSPEGEVLAALVVSMPLYRYRHDLRGQIRQLLFNGAEEISDRLAQSCSRKSGMGEG